MGSAATEPSAACCQRFGKQSNVLNKQLIRWNDLVAKQPWCRRYAVFSIPKRNNQTVFTEHPKQQRYVHWSVLLTRSQLQADLLFGQFQMLRKSALGPFYCVSFVELILLGVSKPRPGNQIRHPKLFHPVAITYFIDKGKLVYLRKIRWFGRMCHIPKQSHYERGPALELLRNSLCELLAKKFGEPGPKQKSLNSSSRYNFWARSRCLLFFCGSSGRSRMTSVMTKPVCSAKSSAYGSGLHCMKNASSWSDLPGLSERPRYWGKTLIERFAFNCGGLLSAQPRRDHDWTWCVAMLSHNSDYCVTISNLETRCIVTSHAVTHWAANQKDIKRFCNLSPNRAACTRTLEQSPICCSYWQGCQAVLISKICPYFEGLCLRKFSVLIFMKCPCFGLHLYFWLISSRRKVAVSGITIRQVDVNLYKSYSEIQQVRAKHCWSKSFLVQNINWWLSVFRSAISVTFSFYFVLFPGGPSNFSPDRWHPWLKVV